MRIHRIAVSAALVLSTAAFGAPAQQTCTLAQMASLDMTNLPDGRFAVPVSINGTEHKFMVDTGGVFSKIAPSVAHKLGLSEGPTQMELYGVAGRMHLSVAEVDSLKLGNNEAKRFHLAVADEDTDPQSGIDGTLAPDLLTLFDVELDFAKGKMNLFSQDHCPGKVVYWTRAAYAELPFHMISGPATVDRHIEMTTSLDGHDLSSILDTGSTTTWLRHKTAVQVFGFDERSPDVETAPYRASGVAIYRKRFGVLHLGGVDAPNPMIDILADQYDASFRQEHSEKSRDDPIYGTSLSAWDFDVGVDVLRKLHVYIAYKERKVYVTAADAH